ncbi:MAG: 3-hydroxyacyl-CoA dehydrogenase NAD-binding domain-containing protein, partial [Halobacteriales archaeon]
MRGVSDIEQVGVVGAGTMGAGIAQVAATNGFDVVMRDVEQSFVEDGYDRIEDSLARLVDRETLSEAEADAAVDRIEGTTDLDDFGDSDVVVEAAVEDMEIKRDVFEDLDALLASDVVVATNTSTLSITSIASATDDPGRVVGLHFMNPVPIMEGVEVVVGEETTEETREIAHDVAEALGKTTWESDDKPGFVTNRILMPWI